MPHPLPISRAALELSLDTVLPGVRIEATVGTVVVKSQRTLR
jgi:hypothetical protein